MKTYTIKKGSNYCREWWRKRLLWKPRGMVAKVKFNGSAIYESEFDGWQKIVGFSLGKHHDNSFRFVWRVVNGFFQIGAYQYIGGVRQEAWVAYSSKIRQIGPYSFGDIIMRENVMYMEIEIVKHLSLVRYRFDDLPAIMIPIPTNHPFPSIGYALQPYYEQPKETPTTAPHDITFEMEVKFY